MNSKKKKVLGIFCHPDDEVLAGWPIFQDKSYDRYLMICCDDSIRGRPHRKAALQEVCKQEGISLVHCLSLDNNFYALPTRRADFVLTDAVEQIEYWFGRAIKEVRPDYIMTHNPMGEYGHGSHRLLFEIISQYPRSFNLIITDICQKSNHRSSEHIPKIIQEVYYNLSFAPNIFLSSPTKLLDVPFYQRCKAVYDKHNAWTWDKPPVPVSSLYLLKAENV